MASKCNRPPSLSNSSSTQPPPLRPALKSSRPSTPFNNGTPPDTEGSPVLTSNSDFFPRSPTGLSQNGYTSKVGFDTFQNPTDATLFSYTLQVKSEGYKRTRSTRSYLCAASGDESGSHALDWVMESLIEEGDELIVFRGFDGEDLDKQMHEQRREEARELMKWIREKNDEVEPGRMKVSIIVEFVGGKITASIERLIALYRPDSLVVGTRGRTVLQQWGAAFGAPGVGSISRYCVSRSPVPVIVVRPESKVRKGMQKRRADPKRGTHFDG
ncbi:hypothetical protein JB92DRAFT_2703956 [Gautieria morchelliformis]|nr:hypothetical protein JB92DRAFT_2703956 [Gautieria morchelliformis]